MTRAQIYRRGFCEAVMAGGRIDEVVLRRTTYRRLLLRRFWGCRCCSPQGKPGVRSEEAAIPWTGRWDDLQQNASPRRHTAPNSCCVVVLEDPVQRASQVARLGRLLDESVVRVFRSVMDAHKQPQSPRRRPSDNSKTGRNGKERNKLLNTENTKRLESLVPI